MEQRLSEGELSLDAPVQEERDSASFGEFIAAGGESTEERVASSELRRVFMEHVREFAEQLDDRERQIVERRVLADEPDTLQELGEDFGVSRERVRQLEARLVDKLRSYLKDAVVDFEYYASPQD
jgi:RNA polymerase sigma-32 factor